MVAPSYVCFEDVTRGLDSPLKTTAARFDTPSLAREAAALSAAALGVLEAAGWPAIHERAAPRPRGSPPRSPSAAGHGRTAGARPAGGWKDADDEATRNRLAAAGVAVRNLPGRGLLRASVGAWNDDADLDRLLDDIAA